MEVDQALQEGRADDARRLVQKKKVDLSYRTSSGWSLLHRAGSVGILVREIIASGGIDIDATDTFGQTALHLACFKGHTSAVNELINAKANIEARERNGNTPLLYSISMKQLEVTDVLIKAGANVSASNTFKDNSAHVAASVGILDQYLSLGFPEVEKTLLETNVDGKLPRQLQVNTVDITSPATMESKANNVVQIVVPMLAIVIALVIAYPTIAPRVL